jgi:pimeloyl-ACP methyl ester carboxylesterase
LEPRFRYVYLHGFASSPLSRKGIRLRAAFREAGVELELPNLNLPTFETITFSAILKELDRLAASDGPSGPRWRLAGSSMGGYLAARWAELHPRRVDRLALLCPGFDLPARWPAIVGEQAMRDWESRGTIELEDAVGKPRPVHWEFVTDARTHPPYPSPSCPVLILHGTRDEVVPIERSRTFAAQQPEARLVELYDDHSLAGSLERVTEECLRFLVEPA